MGQLLPVALAAALSTVPITAMLLILLSPKRGVAALPFLFGSVIGMAFVVALTTLAAQALPERARDAQPIAAAIEVLGGLALVALGIRSWRHRGRPDGPDRPPVWAAAIDSLTGPRALGLGLLLDLRPKNLILAAVVGVQLELGSHRLAERVAVGLIYVALATSTVTVPIVATLVAPRRMEPKLAAAAKRMDTEASVISAVVLVMIGVVVAGIGLQNL